MIPVIPFLVVLLIRAYLCDRKRIRDIMGILLGTVLLGGVFGAADQYLFRGNAEGKEYFEYHLNAIAPILDNEVNAGYSFDPEALDLEVADLMLLNEFHYADFEYFSVERLKGLQEMNQESGIWERFKLLPEILPNRAPES